MGHKVFVLFTGDYEQRGIHSMHSTREAAVTTDGKVRRTWSTAQEEPDIEEHELDENLCVECGYDEDMHIKHPDTWKHQFVSGLSVNGEGSR